MTADHSHTIRTRVRNLEDALKPLGLTIPDAPTTTAPVIPDVTREDIAEAVAAAKDPAGDKSVQRLVTAHQLGELGIAAGIRTVNAKAHDAAIRAALPDLNEAVHRIFDDAAEKLHENGEQFKGHEDLGAVNLSKLPAHSAAAAQAALDAVRTLTLARTAWVTLTTYGGTPGHKAHWTDYGAPTQAEYARARDARPQTFPEPSPWSVYRKGWTLDLPGSVKAARQRRAAYQSTAIGTEQATANASRKAGLRGSVFL